ncbi:hypothetical protein VNO78_21257 [Psophocarpus tetragonolobus]|uniref:Uncharacterized protein n=1 Tax=Psophocarpus tetragonolobus TaxID=3891 RepID=A0AAN9SAV3_PSOTE
MEPIGGGFRKVGMSAVSRSTIAWVVCINGVKFHIREVEELHTPSEFDNLGKKGGGLDDTCAKRVWMGCKSLVSQTEGLVRNFSRCYYTCRQHHEHPMLRWRSHEEPTKERKDHKDDAKSTVEWKGAVHWRDRVREEEAREPVEDRFMEVEVQYQTKSISIGGIGWALRGARPNKRGAHVVMKKGVVRMQSPKTGRERERVKREGIADLE